MTMTHRQLLLSLFGEAVRTTVVRLSVLSSFVLHDTPKKIQHCVIYSLWRRMRCIDRKAPCVFFLQILSSARNPVRFSEYAASASIFFCNGVEKGNR